jgi:hypothetical protein
MLSFNTTISVFPEGLYFLGTPFTEGFLTEDHFGESYFSQLPNNKRKCGDEA